MKKILRFILVLTAIAVVAIIVLSMMQPNDVFVSRSILIKAPKETVFDEVVKFRNWPHWSPWSQKDTSLKITYDGTDGQPGSSYHWIGDKELTGEGDMKNIAVEGTKMDYEINVIKPWQMTATGSLIVKDTIKGMVRVTWTFNKHTPFPWNAMNMFVDMDKYMGGDFELGLNTMKTYMESHTTPLPDVDIKEVYFATHTYIGIRKTLGWTELINFFMESDDVLTAGAAAKINGPYTGLFYTWDTISQTTDAVAGFSVSDTTIPVKDATYLQVPGAKAYMAVHKGGYATMKSYHFALAAHLAYMGKKQALAIEEYIVNPQQEADSNKWVTNIYYLVQ